MSLGNVTPEQEHTPPNGTPRSNEESWFTRLTLAPMKLAPWYRFPRLIGATCLIGVRNVLRQQNLYDTDTGDADPVVAAPKDDRYLHARTVDGSYNDLAVPAMGAAGARFGRNVPLEYTHAEP